MKTETTYKTTQEIIDGAKCPLPLSVIPNHMGINLVAVKGVKWEKRDDGQLVNLAIQFNPKQNIKSAKL